MEYIKKDKNIKVISVKYSDYAACEDYLIRDDYKIGDPVLIYTQRGQEIGTIIKTVSKPVSDKVPYVIGTPKQEQLDLYKFYKKTERKIIDEAQELADQLQLQMSFVGCERTLEQKQLHLFFEAEQRVDFRQLLKDLASAFSARIELIQIGARVSAGFIGGIGICGQPLCCATFLKKFETITLNKAKNQNLALNTQKLSGKCGRLKCCLSFEDDMYTEEKKHLPNVGKKFIKDGKEYTITSVNVLNKMIKCETNDEVEFVPYNEIKKYLHF